MTIWAILPAAGIGRRMGSSKPKQYLLVNGVPVISCTLQRLAAVPYVHKIVVVLHADDGYWSELDIGQDKRIVTTIGGEERSQSVLNGLKFIEPQARADDWVLVHDAVRPCVRCADIEHLIASLENHPVGGLLGFPVDNTLKRLDENGNVISTIDRDACWNALTPQMYRFGLLLDAIERVVSDSGQATDETAAIERLGHKPKMIKGSKDNLKITHDSDLVLAGKILEAQDEAI